MKTSTTEVLCDGCKEPIPSMHPTAVFMTLQGPTIRHRKGDFHDMTCLYHWVAREFPGDMP